MNPTEYNLNAATRAIALADDVSIVRALEFFHAELSKVLPASTDELLKQFDGLPNREQSVGSLVAFLGESAGKDLSTADSVSLARWILVTAADSQDGERFVLHCVQDWPDDRQTVGKTIAVGTIGALWLVLATTEVAYKDGHLEIHKKPVVPENIEATASVLKAKFQIKIFDPDRGPIASAAPKAKPAAQPPKKKAATPAKKTDC